MEVNIKIEVWSGEDGDELVFSSESLLFESAYQELAKAERRVKDLEGAAEAAAESLLEEQEEYDRPEE